MPEKLPTPDGVGKALKRVNELALKEKSAD